MFVLGVDPGLSRCGYGVVQRKNGKENALAAGVIQTPEMETLSSDFTKGRSSRTDADYKPDVVAIERVLFNIMRRQLFL